MKIGTLVTLNSRYYTDVHKRIGIVIRVFTNRHCYHVLWSDGSDAILEYFDLEKVC